MLAASRLCAALALCLLIVGPPAALAQNDVGSIVGFVTDQSGAIVANATVTITNEGTGEKRTVSTDAQGHWLINTYDPG